MQTNFDPNSTDFYYQWGKECALNNLTTNQLDYMIKEMPTVTEQIQSDIYQGYKENIMGELRTDFYQWGKDCAEQNMSLTDAIKTVKTELTQTQSEEYDTFIHGYQQTPEQKETEKVEPETRTFEIYYTDLNESAKKEICETFDTSPEEENWDMNILPLAIFERTMEDEED